MCKPLNIHTTKEVLGGSGLAWETGFVKYLGIIFGNDLRSKVEENERSLLNKIKNRLETWSTKYLTWWGRAEAIKMTITPMVNYLLGMLPIRCTDDFHKQLDRRLNTFLWKDKKARFSLAKLRLPRSWGA